MSIGGSTGTSDSAVRRLAGELWRLGKRSRPRFWLYLAGPAVVGIAYGASSVGELTSPLSVVLVGYFLIPANVYLYGVNDIFDAEIDRRNPKKDDREVRYDGDRLTVPAVLLSGLGAIAITAVAPAPARPWLGAFLVLATAYSAPPVRLKVRPLLDSLSNGLYVLPGAGAYAALSGAAPPAGVLLGAWLWTMGMHTFSAIPDIEPDRRGGIQTTATVLGHRRALAYCFACWLGAVVAMAVIDIQLGALFGLYPVLLAAMAASNIDIDRAYWWFPYVNTLVGMVFTLGGLWVIVHG